VRHDGQVPKKKQKSDKARSDTEKQLKATVKKLQAQLGAAEKSAEKWRSRAKGHQSAAAETKAALTAVRRRLEKVEASAVKWKDRSKGGAPAAPVAEPPSGSTAARGASATPDDSWTVTALRSEARARGVVGYSRKTKAQLLADLRG
jgi:hypothetical protein